eukprot:SAG25_NODE_442_length_7969_cov_22.346203_4_plen_66_part_00
MLYCCTATAYGCTIVPCLVRLYCTFALGCHLQGGKYRVLVRGGCSRPKIRSGIRIRAQKQAESSG